MQPHRAPAQFNQGAGDDQKIAQMLTLYQTPATIRDMKQTFFYLGISANTTRLNFWRQFYNNTTPASAASPTPIFDTYSKFMYYAPIGTTRNMDISQYINDLLDIRVPKDKYFIELNMVECTIEADPSGWSQIPDRVFRDTTGTGVFELEPTFNWIDSASATPTGTPSRTTIGTTLTEATKLSSPQTLFCRIKECSNSEPYNWAITNSGQFSQDKSHQVVIRHSDIDVSRLTLEFGHLAFTGVDEDYKNFINDPSKQNSQYIVQSAITGGKRLNYKSDAANRPVYMDYNQEYFNALATPLSDGTNFADFYKGRFDFPTLNTYTTNYEPFVEPSSRVPYYNEGVGQGVVQKYNLQGRPYLYNQQAAKLNFRFMVKIIHMF